MRTPSTTCVNVSRSSSGACGAASICAVHLGAHGEDERAVDRAPELARLFDVDPRGALGAQRPPGSARRGGRARTSRARSGSGGRSRADRSARGAVRVTKRIACAADAARPLGPGGLGEEIARFERDRQAVPRRDVLRERAAHATGEGVGEPRQRDRSRRRRRARRTSPRGRGRRPRRARRARDGLARSARSASGSRGRRVGMASTLRERARDRAKLDDDGADLDRAGEEVARGSPFGELENEPRRPWLGDDATRRPRRARRRPGRAPRPAPCDIDRIATRRASRGRSGATAIGDGRPGERRSPPRPRRRAGTAAGRAPRRGSRRALRARGQSPS